MIAHLNLRRNLAALYIAIGAHACAFYILYNTLVLWLISLGLPKVTATSRFGVFVLAAYMTPWIGGWLSQPLGLRLVAIIGAATAASGYLLTTISPLGGIVLIGIGCGFVKTSVTAMVGRLFPEGAPGADKAFAWFYSAINVGALFSPLVASYMMARYSFTAAFAVAALGDLIVLASIVLNYHSLDNVESKSTISAVTGVAVSLSDHETESDLVATRRRKLIALWIFLVLATVAFWPAYHQNGTGLNIWASEHTDRETRWGVIQPPMFSLVNSLVCIFCGGMIVAATQWVARWARRRGKTTCSRMATRFTICGERDSNGEVYQWCEVCAQTPPAPLSFSTVAGYLIMAASFACLLVAPHAAAHPLWLIVAIVLSSVAEILISSLGLAQVAKLTPRHLQPIYTSIWFITSGIGGQIAGQLGGVELMTGFRILIVLCLTGAAISAMLRRRLDV